MKIQALFNTRVPVMAALLGMAVALGSCSSEENALGEGGKTTGTETDKNLTTFVADAPVSDGTRTSMNASGVFKWEAGDNIYVKDDDNTWQVSNAVDAAGAGSASFKFKVPGKFTGSNTYTVYYPGRNGNQDKVTISASQSQADPDKPSHVGVSGDCGWATATAASGTKRFNFTLDHKAAFLVFSPYCNNNPVIQNNYIKLTKIEITSDNDLVGTYTLDPATNRLTGTGSGKQINLTTGGSATPNGFSVPTAATPATNASYVVIKPGTHTLRVRFWLKDYVTNVEGTVTKLYPSFTYAANTYYTMQSELKVKDYPGNNYYMWDAQQQYWYGHEWNKPGYVAGTDQPTVKGHTGSAYPKPGDADRYCNTTIPAVGEGTHGLFNPSSPQHVPNANEMSWYVMKGDPRRDGDELWTTMGHLYKGGMWFKKKAKISNFSSSVSADGSTDMRTTYKSYSNTPTNVSSNPIGAADQSDYFYLPALGNYASASLINVGNYGIFWSSSAKPGGSGLAYYLVFDSGSVGIGYGYRGSGLSVVPFE